MSQLGVYWSVAHRRKQDYEYFKSLQPTAFKIMDGGPPDYQFVNENLSSAYVLARDWALSEQHDDMLKDPVATGVRHAQEWNNKQPALGFVRDRTLILGINEPKVWDPGVAEALRLYTISMCAEASKYGLHVGAMQLGVGWPGNAGPDTPPDWSIFHGVDQAILKNGGALICHEYWANNGPAENWGWWAGRTLKCPWQVPIIIGECGIDMFVKDTSVGQQRRGWIGNVSASRYASELWDYTHRMSQDPRFVGCCVFASDFAAHEWYSFDLFDSYKEVLHLLDGGEDRSYTVHLPIVYGDQHDYNNVPTAVVDVAAGANIRSGPDVGYEKIGAEPTGTPLHITGKNEAGDWWQVDTRFGPGWVSEFAVQTFNVGDVPVVQGGAEQPTEPPLPIDKFKRTMQFIHRWEGGFQDFEWDAGNWTGCKPGVGERKGTKFGISACAHPNLDIEDLTMEQADEIYRHEYWEASSADKLPWPMCLVVMDTAVLHGVGAAQAWSAKHGNDPVGFAAERLQMYVGSDIWDKAGNAWVRRVAELLQEASE